MDRLALRENEFQGDHDAREHTRDGRHTEPAAQRWVRMDARTIAQFTVVMIEAAQPSRRRELDALSEHLTFRRQLRAWIDDCTNQLEHLRAIGFIDMIQVESKPGWFGLGPSYFVSNPEVSSDLVALLRYGLGPDDPGRSLELVEKPFWRLPEERGKDAAR